MTHSPPPLPSAATTPTRGMMQDAIAGLVMCVLHPVAKFVAVGAMAPETLKKYQLHVMAVGIGLFVLGVVGVVVSIKVLRKGRGGARAVAVAALVGFVAGLLMNVLYTTGRLR
ncbi:MAG TPA: hypothetical protein VEA69_01725 [Tepidisphaeraceae bacterium]|nr:hypothetical protein [Tepidisphaeraceae bacterium]